MQMTLPCEQQHRRPGESFNRLAQRKRKERSSSEYEENCIHVHSVRRRSENRSERVERVAQFEFLGSVLTDNGDIKPEITRRLAKGRQVMSGLTKLWMDKNISTQTKARLVRSLVHPVATYASESWITTKTLRRKIQSFKMWCWRRMLRVPWTERRSNVKILQQVGNPIPLDGTIIRQKPVYLRRITRGNQLEKVVMTGMANGKRGR
ncbi:uncharacterized protein LOC121308759 [Polyodon spathula]|uniref:uncharacterized protein LOC121308759 n=1 Tax=Polyodon spathula TaxID=7913 RepID=UPI001B7EC52A|nr:uncharacterized protein LOC121308759 [Polyodon spathula]